LKYFDGSLAKIERVPPHLRELYATAFEIEPRWIVEAGSRRQKWIDQAQSLNIYMAGASGKKLDDTYKLAWTKGLKTTYYLRALAVSSAEKSTGRGGELNAVSAHAYVAAAEDAAPKFCAIDDPTCEACQ
ncbi:MAG: ribonucleoside-diphosphate reductase subunit alpha, partial [Burkholderiales bacterium]|nr:ribonucleoside-diphosphate reductase subunit alpha [Burkholderiales bacterium]